MRKPGLILLFLIAGLLVAGLRTGAAQGRALQGSQDVATHVLESPAAPEQETETPTTMATDTELAPTTAAPTETEIPPATSTPTSQPTATPEALSITGVEPSRISTATGGSLSIYGTGFTQGLAVRLVGYGLLDATIQNNTAIRAVVPPGLKTGRYDLEIILANGVTASVGNAVRITSPEEPTTDTPTPTPAPLTVFGQPQLLIQGSQTTPETLRPGEPFDLSIVIINRGDYTATNIRLSLVSLDTAIPQGSSSLAVIDLIQADENQTIALSLALTEEVSPGFKDLELLLEYDDYYGREYTSTQSIGLDISDSIANQPLVLLTAYQTQPETLSPGDTFSLQMEVSNVGRNPAQQLLITLGGEDGSGIQPFAIIGSGNIQYVPELAAGENLTLERQLLLDGAANSGVYNLPVSLTYDSPGGTRQTENQVLNLLASRRPNLQIDFYRTVEPGLVDQPLELPIELVNIGRSLVNISTVEVSGEQLEIVEGSAFIGVLDGGTSGSFDAMVIPTQGGSIPVEVRVHYLDDFNQPQVISETLTIVVETPEVAQPDAEEQPGETLGFWDRVLRFLRGLFGLGS